MRAFSVRFLLALLAVGVGFLPTFGFCYHVDGGTCLEVRAGACCEDDSGADASSPEDCPDCTDVLANPAVPSGRAELAGIAGWERGLQLAISFSDGVQVLGAPSRRAAWRDGPARQSGSAALLSLPLRC